MRDDETPILGPPTIDDLLRHYRAYGLDNANTGYRGKKETYGSYKRLRGDALVTVARETFGVEGYVQVLQAIGYGQWEDEARKDWAEVRDEWAENRALFDRYWGTD